MTELEIKELVQTSALEGTRSYPKVIPKILAELLALRRKIKEMEIERATDVAARP